MIIIDDLVADTFETDADAWYRLDQEEETLTETFGPDRREPDTYTRRSAQPTVYSSKDRRRNHGLRRGLSGTGMVNRVDRRTLRSHFGVAYIRRVAERGAASAVYPSWDRRTEERRDGGDFLAERRSSEPGRRKKRSGSPTRLRRTSNYGRRFDDRLSHCGYCYSDFD